MISFLAFARMTAPLMDFDLGRPETRQDTDRWRAAEKRALDAQSQEWERGDIRGEVHGVDPALRARIKDSNELIERINGREPQDIVRLSEKAKAAYAALEKLKQTQGQMAAMLASRAGGGDVIVHLAALSSTGDDVAAFGSHVTVSGGAGDDAISVQDDSEVDGGAGDDYIEGYARLVAAGGDGRDTIEGQDDAVIDAGAGDDVVNVYAGGTIRGGAGHDVITGYERTWADAGDGDDYIQTYGESTLFGGAGGDMIFAGDGSLLDGGAGDDLLVSGRDSTVIGGAGNDYVSGGTILYNRGDGHDRLSTLAGDTKLLLGVGITRADVTAAVDEYGILHIAIDGGTGSMATAIWSGDSAVTFADGSTAAVRDLIPGYEDPPHEQQFQLARQFWFRRASGDLAG